MNKRWAIASLAALFGLTGCERGHEAPQAHSWHDEVIYHVMPRSFHDSNGDGHGDLNGFVEKLDYLEELGVTAILFTPLYESDFYHNYFPIDYESIDPEYGTMEDYLAFVKAVHARDMKFIMDMETQYAPEGHRWLDESMGNPASPYSDFIAYADANNEIPEQFWVESGAPLTPYNVWPDMKRAIAHLDLNHPRVRQWMSDFFVYWVDPNGDGQFDDGVDGFRIDHIMDDLDDRGRFTNLYRDLWRPIFERCRSINPEVFIVGEQADWGSTGADMVAQSGADASFHFALHAAITGHEGQDGPLFDRERIVAAVEASLAYAPGSPYVVNFIENHDTTRFATLAGRAEGPLRAAAALNMLLPGIPSIYYAQELGMTGRKLSDVPDSDGIDIPKREAFPWSADADADGMALWYKDSGPWWNRSVYHSPYMLTLALESQRADADSLWNHSRGLIEVRKAHVELRRGDFAPVDVGEEELFAFRRDLAGSGVVVIVNLSNETKTLRDIELQAWSYVVLEQAPD